MREWQSQSHVRWYCRYHVVWVPKYRKRAIFGEMRRGVGRIVREWCQRHGVELVEGHALSDHVHVLLGIRTTEVECGEPGGVLERKSAIRIHREYLGRPRNFTGYHLWARGYCVSTVGLAEEVIRDYIQKQEADEKKQEKLEPWLIEGPFEGPSSYRPLRGR